MANQNDNDNDEIEIQHRLLIEEEKIEISDLPTEIRNEMRNFNKKLLKYEESGDSEIFLELQQDDVAIAENILTFIEDSESEEEEEEEEETEEEEGDDDGKSSANGKGTATATKPAPVVTPVVTAPVATETDTPPVVTPTPTPIPTPTPVAKSAEEQVKEAMKDGVISVTDLERILNQEPDYPTQMVGNLKLKKQYMRPYYEVA